MTIAADGGLQYVRPVGEWKNVRERSYKNRERLDRDKKTAEKNHRKTEEVGEGLRFEDLFNRDGNKKAQEGRSHGNQEDCTQYRKPVDAG